MYRGSRTQTYIAIAVGLAFAAQHIATYLRLDEVAVDLYEVIFISVGIALLVPFVLWLVATLLMTIVARLVTGRLTTGDIFRLSGWGLLPLVASGLAQSAGRYYALRDAEPPELGMFSHLSVEWERYVEYLDTAAGDPVFLAATVVALLFVLPTGYIWMLVVEVVGDEDNADVNTTKAALVAALPTLLCALWVLQPYLR